MMDSKEMVKELLGELVTEETVYAAVREIVSNKFDYHLEETIRTAARITADEKAKEYIKEKVDEVLDTPVKKDDGWGHVEHYDSFEQFVKQQISDLLNKDYRFRNTVDKMVEDRLDGVIKKVSKEMSKKMVDEALAEMADTNGE